MQCGTPPPPLPQAILLPPPPNQRLGGAHSPAGGGWGSSNSDDWRKNLALCPLCARKSLYMMWTLFGPPPPPIQVDDEVDWLSVRVHTLSGVEYCQARDLLESIIIELYREQRDVHLFRSHPHNPRVIRKSDRQDFRDEASLIGNQLAQADTVNLFNKAENIKWFMEDQAFLPSYHLAPPTTFPLSREQVVSRSQSSCMSPVDLSDGRRGKEPNHMTPRKRGPL